MKLYNTLTRKIEKFTPLNRPDVGIYTCGPTVYNFAHIGNFRTYILSDILVRTLNYLDYKVKHVINITDVGHLTGDNLGDADTGEDRMEKSAKREGKTVWDIAKFYTDAFLIDSEKLNLLSPFKLVKATDHIREQIELVKKLEKKGFTYRTSCGIYFDTSKFTGYGKLSTLDQIKEGARVEKNPEKKNPRDFALWKFSPVGEKRQMEWKSPWGVGFPGWHLECSAMSMKYLGESFDIHVGGVDLSSTHHPNEIAQSEAVTSKTFVKYWVHGEFILVDGERMSKSLGNVHTVGDLEEKGIEPLALRLLFLQTYYRQQMNFTWESAMAAQEAYNKLRDYVILLRRLPTAQFRPSQSAGEPQDNIFRTKFKNAISNDLQMPKAVAVVWEMLKSNVTSQEKLNLLLEFDQVLGLKLSEVESLEVPRDVQKLLDEREVARKNKDFTKSDELRRKIQEKGYIIEDLPEGYHIKRLQNSSKMR